MLAVRLLMDSLKKSDPGGQAESSMVASTISDVSLPTQNGRDPIKITGIGICSSLVTGSFTCFLCLCFLFLERELR